MRATIYFLKHNVKPKPMVRGLALDHKNDHCNVLKIKPKRVWKYVSQVYLQKKKPRGQKEALKGFC